MKNKNKHLLIEQLDKKIAAFKVLEKMPIPSKGWLNSIRTSLNMTLGQLGYKLKITAQSVKELEDREATGAITIKTLREAAAALDMKLIYGLIPKDESIDQMIEKRAHELAKIIVLRTSNSMKLEDQEVPYSRIEKAIKEKTSEIKDELPKYLWD